jgi:hypothetical protein
MTLRIREENGSIIIESPDYKTAIELQLGSADGQNTITLHPPAEGKRTKITFSDGSARPLSIEVHGTADVYDPANKDVTFYTEIPGMGVNGRMFEWRWGDHWEGLLRIPNAGLQVGGRVGFNGAEAIDKPVVTGDRVLVVLKNLLKALASMGLIDDQTAF